MPISLELEKIKSLHPDSARSQTQLQYRHWFNTTLDNIAEGQELNGKFIYS